jgi:hypothetical protein
MSNVIGAADGVFFVLYDEKGVSRFALPMSVLLSLEFVR